MITKAKSKKAYLRGILFLNLLLFFSCGKPEKDGLIPDALSDPGISWASEKSENFLFYAPEGSYAAERFPELVKKAEAARRLVMERLQEVKQEDPPALVFLDSRAQLKKFGKIAAGGRAVVEENGIFYVLNDSTEAPLQHELGHLFSWRSWGDPAGYWLSEGVAVYAAGNCAGEELHAWAAKLALDKELTNFTDLEREFDFSKPEPHLQAGSFVKFIMEKYGVSSFKMVWKKGLSASSEATGLEVGALLEKWTAHIMQDEFTAAAQFLELGEKISCE